MKYLPNESDFDLDQHLILDGCMYLEMGKLVKSSKVGIYRVYGKLGGRGTFSRG